MQRKILVIVAVAVALLKISAVEPSIGLIPNVNNLQLTKSEICHVNPIIRVATPQAEVMAEILACDLGLVTGLEFSVVNGIGDADGIWLVVDPENQVLRSLPETYGTDPSPVDACPEGYSIEVINGRATLTAMNLRGLRNACSTLRQMAKAQDGKLALPGCSLADAPVLAWRGFLLDTSRHFFPVDEVKRVIDVLALYKMNVLHLHLTDNQGWRFEVKGYQPLSEDYYTQEQYSGLVNYAQARGITIVPELDLPGHSGAVFKAFPHFSNTASLPFEFNFPGQDICALDPDDAEAMQFVTDAIKQLCALTTGRYIHIGGDETFGMHDEPYTKFVKQAKQIVHDCGKQVAGWQEMARADIGDGDVVQNWIKFSKKQMEMSKANVGQKSSLPEEVGKMLGATYMKAPSDLPTSIDNGAKILLSPQAFAYCDCPFEEENLNAEYAGRTRELGLKNYAPQNLRDIYEWNPTTLYPFLGIENIAGVEGTLFCETIGNLDDALVMMLPRLASIAEHGWNCGSELSWTDFSAALPIHEQLYVRHNWPFFKSPMITR